MSLAPVRQLGRGDAAEQDSLRNVEHLAPPHNLAAIKPGHRDAIAGAALATGCPVRRDRMSSLCASADNPACGDEITAGPLEVSRVARSLGGHTTEQEKAWDERQE